MKREEFSFSFPFFLFYFCFCHFSAFFEGGGFLDVENEGVICQCDVRELDGTLLWDDDVEGCCLALGCGSIGIERVLMRKTRAHVRTVEH